MSSDQEFYFNLETHEVEEGKVSSWNHRMGPYPTRDAAEHALEHARKRNLEADEQEAIEHEQEER